LSIVKETKAQSGALSWNHAAIPGLHAYLRWWIRTIEDWQLLPLLTAFQERCFDDYLKIFTEAMIRQRFKMDEHRALPSVLA
jgi:hypothetical protein